MEIIKHGVIRLHAQVVNGKTHEVEQGEVIAEASCVVSYNQEGQRIEVKFPSGLDLEKGRGYYLVFPLLHPQSPIAEDNLERVNLIAQASVKMTKFDFRRLRGE